LAAKSLKPKSIQDITRLVRSILASAVDPVTLDPLYPRTWNTRAIGAPRVKAQHQPAATAEQIKAIIHNRKINLRNRVLIATLAATGLRSGECLAIKCMPRADEFTTWDVATATIYVRKSLWRGNLQRPKTDAAIRDVELSKETNDMLREFAKSHKLGDFLFHAKSGKPLDDAYVRRDVLTPLGIDGAHSLRRFRTTRLRDEILVPESILRGWIGHAVVGGFRKVFEAKSRTPASMV
jgi:integrase